jgi:starvation-inducible DNA-binding protein
VEDLDIPTRWSGFSSRQLAARPATSAANVQRLVRGVGGERGWYGFGPLWALRGAVDKVVGGVGLRRGRRHPDDTVGEALDFWRVDTVDDDLFRLHAEMKAPGEAWLEWRTAPAPDGSGTVVTQRARFVPRGIFGRIYWWVRLVGQAWGISNHMSNVRNLKTTVPALSEQDSLGVIEALQDRLVALIDLQLTLKHVHWNVVGMNFIAIHEMLDPQVDVVRLQSDAVAERIAILGGEPKGTPGAVVEMRSWSDYDLDRAPSVQHLVALDDVYSGVIADHRAAITKVGEIDPITEDLLIGHVADLELFQWFVRAHLKDATGDVVHRSTHDKS